MATITPERPQEKEIPPDAPSAPTPTITALAAAPQPRRRKKAGPDFNQYVVSQLPLLLAIALMMALIFYGLWWSLPAGWQSTFKGTEYGAAKPAAAAPATFSSETVAQQITVNADASGAPKWERAEYSATAGDVTFVVKNPSSVVHNFGVEGNGIKVYSDPLLAGKSGNFTLKGLKPGEYIIVCTVSGHREAGMVAKLIVK